MSHHLPKDMLKRLGSEIAKEREEKEFQEKASRGVPESFANIEKRLESLEIAFGKMLLAIRIPAQYPERRHPIAGTQGDIERARDASSKGGRQIKTSVSPKPPPEIDI